MTPPSHGLLRTIGLGSLVALMVNSILGVSIFKLPADLAGLLGSWSPLACLLAGAAILVIAACIAEVSSRHDGTGGLYLYARDALGRFAGLLVAWLTWLTRIAAPAAGANLFCSYAAQFIPYFATRAGELLLLALLIGHLALLNYIGVSAGKRVSNVFTAVKVGFLFFFVFAGLLALFLHPSLRVAPLHVSPAGRDWFTALLLLVFAYGGFEGALFVGGESRNPKRDTPVALLLALGLIAVIYTAIQAVVLFTLPAAAQSPRPLADATERFLGPIGGTLIALAALISAYGYLSANLLHAPRITFAMAEQGDFPAFLGKIHPRFRTPYISILVYALLVFAFAAVGNFAWNAVLSAVSRLAVYAAMALSVPILRRRPGPAAEFQIPLPYLFSAFGLLFSVVLLSQMRRAEFLVVSVTCAIAFLNYLVVRRRSAAPARN